MKTILILVILLASPVSATWAQIVDGDGIPLDTCTEEEAISIFKAFGHSLDTLTHYQVIDTTVDSFVRFFEKIGDDLELFYRYDTTIDTTWHKKIPERGEHFIPIIFINTPGLIGCADTIWVDTTDPNTYLRVTTSGEPLNRFYGMGIENDWKYEITIEFISDGVEKRKSKAIQFKGIEPPKPGYWENINGRMGQITELGDTIWLDRQLVPLIDSFGIFDTAFKKADKEFKNIEDRWNEIQDRKHPMEE